MTIPLVDVAIIGGGPGGLALTQGLKKNGIDTAVFERDPVRADYVQGFRMRIRQRGIDALEANLPAHLFQAFLDTLGIAPTENLALDETFQRLENASQGSGDPEDTHIEKSVSRITLRQILVSGLEDIFPYRQAVRALRAACRRNRACAFCRRLGHTRQPFGRR